MHSNRTKTPTVWHQTLPPLAKCVASQTRQEKLRWRNSISPATKVLHVEELSTAELYTLALSLERFVLEIRNKQGSEYAPGTLHHLVCEIMRHVRVTLPRIDFFF